MGTHFTFTCPHCSTRGAGFEVVFQWSDRSHSNRANLLAICGVCDLGITIKSESTHSTSHVNLTQHPITYPDNRFRVVSVWPAVSFDLPSGVPENISNFYLQGLENLQGRRWDAAGAMFRKALDVATKIIAPGSKKMTLFKRIEELSTQGLITKAMGEWSHEIRLDGNESVHDDEPETPSDAISMQRFTEAFLNYAFSLPTLVAANRSKRQTPSVDVSE